MEVHKLKKFKCPLLLVVCVLWRFEHGFAEFWRGARSYRRQTEKQKQTPRAPPGGARRAREREEGPFRG